MGTCNNQQPSNNMNAVKARGCTRKLDAISSGASTAMTTKKSPSKRQRLVEPSTAVAQNVANNAISSNDVEDAVELTVTELNSQAMSFYSRGDFDMAGTLFRKAISLRSPKATALEKVEQEGCSASVALPPPSSYIYQRMDFDEGMSVYSEPMPIQAHDHPQAVEATLLFNAGKSRAKLNDVEGAYNLYDQALKIFQPSDQNNSLSLIDLASIRNKHAVTIPLLHAVGQQAYIEGKLQDALKIYEAALQLCKDFHPNDEIAKARTLNCLGVLCYHLSIEHSERAKKYFEEALQIHSRESGDGSVESATILNNLGRVHVQREEFETALKLYERALEIRRKLGVDHIDYAATAFNAGQSLHQLGHYDRALTFYQEFLRVAEKKFTRNHRDVAVVLSGIAQIYQEKKDYQKAVSLYEESLVVGRAALGNSHSEVAMLLNRLGNYYFDRGNFTKALAAYEEGLLIEQRVLEEAHPNIVVTLTNIGEIYRQKNDLQKAIRLYLEALRLQKKCYGVSSVEVAATLNVLGLLYDQTQNPTMALSCLQEALVIRRCVLGDVHADVSATLTYLATIFYRRGSTCMALQLFSESLRIRTELYGKAHRDVSFALYNVGLCHFNIGCYDEAIASYKETLRIEQKVLGSAHKDVGMTWFKLGEVYAANRDFSKALESFQAALKIEREAGNEADPKTLARILNEIGNVHLANQNLQLMMDSYVEAARVLIAAGLFQLDSLTLPDQLYKFEEGRAASAA